MVAGVGVVMNSSTVLSTFPFLTCIRSQGTGNAFHRYWYYYFRHLKQVLRPLWHSNELCDALLLSLECDWMKTWTSSEISCPKNELILCFYFQNVKIKSFTITEERRNDPDNLSCRSLILCQFDSWVNRLMSATQQLAADSYIFITSVFNHGKTFKLRSKVDASTLQLWEKDD